MTIDVLGDRGGDFEPRLVEKYQTNVNELERKVISMYGKGMTVSDLNEHLAEIYGIQVTDWMISEIKEWHSRKLEKNLFDCVFDGLHHKVRENGSVDSKAAYMILGIDSDRKKDILAICIAEEEGAKF